MKEKVALYTLCIAIVAMGALIYNHLVNGEQIVLGRLVYVFILPPIGGFMIWLRWDWAHAKGLEKRAERARKKARRDAEEK